MLPREELSQNASSTSATHAEEVERVGQFSVRGGIVDIFAINAAVPVRVEYFDDEIDSLREFDLDTKRSTKNVGAATIMPLAQTDASGKPELFLSYLEGKGTVLFDEPTRIRDTIRTMVKENPDIKGKIFSWEELLQAAHGNRIVYMALLLQQVPGADTVENIGVTATTMTPFRRQMDLLENEANRWLAQKQRVLVPTEKANSSSRTVGHSSRTRQSPSTMPSTSAGDPCSQDSRWARLVVVTEKDIFGLHRHTGPQAQRLRREDLAFPTSSRAITSPRSHVEDIGTDADAHPQGLPAHPVRGRRQALRADGPGRPLCKVIAQRAMCRACTDGRHGVGQARARSRSRTSHRSSSRSTRRMPCLPAGRREPARVRGCLSL